MTFTFQRVKYFGILFFFAFTILKVTPSFGDASTSGVNDFKILWWNIGGANFKGLTVDQYPYDHSNIDSAILALSKNQNPDVYIFAEYYVGFLKPETEGQLALSHPYKFFLSYNSVLPDLGVVVYSKTKFTSIYQKAASLNFEDAALYPSYPRRFQMLQFSIEFNGGQCNLNVFPIHLLMPWDHMNSANAAEQILWGRNNSLTQQIHLFEDFISTKNSGLALILGDFNLPSSFLGQVPLTFSDLKKKYNLVPSFGLENSFDSPSENGLLAPFKKVKLDHAFWTTVDPTISFKFQSEILEKSGSDHRPMMVRMNQSRN